MSGFIRRYSYFPGQEVITLIEGAVVIDAPPPGAITGSSTGVACLVGEFADVTYGVQVDGSGNVSTKAQPVEVFSAQDLLDKVGGFDETLGEFGVSGGNGYVALRNKKFSRLILVPVNNASSKAIRLFRDLPTNVSATNATPIVPMQGAKVAAGREFKSSTNRVRIAQAVSFTADIHYASGVDGAVTAAGSPAATQSFSSAGGLFTTIQRPDGKTGVQVGDVIVIGVIGGAAGLGANAATYRVATVTSATALVLEKLDGTTFDWTTASALPWRIHPGVAADSATAGYGITSTAGYDVPARPLDATVAHDVVMAPTVVPSAGTATSWDILSGLTARTMAGSGGDLVYTAAVQAPNAVASATVDALYATAIDALLADSYPGREVNILWTARTDSTLRAKLRTHVATSSGTGVGRVACVSPEVSQVSETTVLGDTDPGVGANRSDRVFYAWPGVQTYVPEAVGFSLKTATGSYDTTGYVDTRTDGWLASVLSNIPPEWNPAQSGSPIQPGVLSAATDFQRGAPTLGIGDYIALRQRGVVAVRFDQTAGGAIFQSGITTSLTAGLKNIARRRMADFIEDSVAARLNQFSKKLMTTQLKDAAVGEVVAFLGTLLSANNPPAQRIAAYQVDSKSGNTPTTLAAGIFVIIGRVQTLASADFLVFQAEIGESVNVSVSG